MRSYFYIGAFFLLYPAVVVRAIADLGLVFQVSHLAGWLILSLMPAIGFLCIRLSSLSLSAQVLSSSLRPLRLRALLGSLLQRIFKNDVLLLLTFSVWVAFSAYIYLRSPCPLNYYDCKIISTPYWFRQVNGVMSALLETSLSANLFHRKKIFSLSSLFYFLLLIVLCIASFLGGSKGGMYSIIAWPILFIIATKYFSYQASCGKLRRNWLISKFLVLIAASIIMFAVIVAFLVKLPISEYLVYLLAYFSVNAAKQSDLLALPSSRFLSSIACESIGGIGFFFKPMSIAGLATPFPNLGSLLSYGLPGYGAHGGFNTSFSLIIATASPRCLSLALVLFLMLALISSLFIIETFRAINLFADISPVYRPIVAMPIASFLIMKLISAPDELIQAIIIMFSVLLAFSALPRITTSLFR